MRREFSAETVMKLVGYTTIGVTEYYNKQIIDESRTWFTGSRQGSGKTLNVTNLLVLKGGVWLIILEHDQYEL
jgi:hypothetical protein